VAQLHLQVKDTQVETLQPQQVTLALPVVAVQVAQQPTQLHHLAEQLAVLVLVAQLTALLLLALLVAQDFIKPLNQLEEVAHN
jgi:hypothetical protein